MNYGLKNLSQPVTRGPCLIFSEAKIWETVALKQLVDLFPTATPASLVYVYVCYWLSYIRLQRVPLSASVQPFMAHSYSNSSQTFNSPDYNRCEDCVQWSAANLCSESC